MMVRSLHLGILICILMTPRLHYAQEKTVKVEEQKSFHVIGLAVRTNNQQEAGGQGEIPRLWQRFMQQDIAGKIPNRAGQNLIVVNTDYESDQNGEYTYFIGARVTSTADVPAGLTLKEIPSGSYAVLESEKGPAPVVLPKIWRQIWSMSAKDLGGERAFRADYEVYPPEYDPQNVQVTIHIGLKQP
jgi:predicted transcriptional regulator YdeE